MMSNLDSERYELENGVFYSVIPQIENNIAAKILLETEAGIFVGSVLKTVEGSFEIKQNESELFDESFNLLKADIKRKTEECIKSVFKNCPTYLSYLSAGDAMSGE